MSTTLATPARNAAANAVVDLVDAGSGPGKIRIKSGAGTVIAEVVFADPAFGNASAGVAAIGAPINGAGLPAAGTGTVGVSFDVTDSDNNICWSGAVGAELQLDNANIANGQSITVDTFSHTQPA